jgi:hypothetical protein
MYGYYQLVFQFGDFSKPISDKQFPLRNQNEAFIFDPFPLFENRLFFFFFTHVQK